MTDLTHKERQAQAGTTPVYVRILVLALVIVLGVLFFGPLVGIGGDAWEAYRDPQRDPVGNHTGVVPYGAPARQQDCTYDGRRLDCGPPFLRHRVLLRTSRGSQAVAGGTVAALRGRRIVSVASGSTAWTPMMMTTAQPTRRHRFGEHTGDLQAGR